MSEKGKEKKARHGGNPKFKNNTEEKIEKEKHSMLFEDVKIGDKAFECNCYRFEGIICAKGSLNDIKQYDKLGYIIENYKGICDHMNKNEMVAIKYDKPKGFEKINYCIFFYNQDTASVCVFEK